MNGEHVEIDWATAREANRENWDDRVPLHAASYGREAFDDPEHISDVIRHDVPVLERFLPSRSVAGLDVCHLQCHIGTDTISLARVGARVTGVDFSAPALETARGFAREHGIDAQWVECDVLEARAAVSGDFDVVYTSIGTICWLSDLERWARQIQQLLRPGGTFFIRDGHPALYALDEDAPTLTARYRYFGDGTAQLWDDASTYSGDGAVSHTRTYEWPHSLAEILSALLAAGLRIVHVDEGRMLPWRFSPRMVEVPGGFAWPEEERDLLPCTYTIIARLD